jgi:hypothetical protein
LAFIEFLDARGRRVDFHSLRHTLNTNLAMEIMRHSDIRLTAKTFTDMGLLPTADAVLDLPSLLGKKAEDSQDLFRNGQNVAKDGTDGHSEHHLKLTCNKEDGQEKVGSVKTGQSLTNGARYRVRTGEFAIEDQELARVDSPEDSLISDPNLAALVTTWHGLTDIQKTDILRIIGRGFSH